MLWSAVPAEGERESVGEGAGRGCGRGAAATHLPPSTLPPPLLLPAIPAARTPPSCANAAGPLMGLLPSAAG